MCEEGFLHQQRDYLTKTPVYDLACEFAKKYEEDQEGHLRKEYDVSLESRIENHRQSQQVGR